MDLQESLLTEVKNEIKITWNSEDDYLKNMIKRGKKALEGETGTKLNFDEEGQPQSLLLSYCRYDYNNALEYFKENFREELIELKFKEAVKARVKEDEG